MTTASLPLLKFRAFLNLEAVRSILIYGEYLGSTLLEWEAPEKYGSFPHLTLCNGYARENLFSLADRCLEELRSTSRGPAEFLAMERILIDYVQQQREGMKEILRLEQAPRLIRFGMDIGMDDLADILFEAHIGELSLWLDKERLDIGQPERADEIQPTRAGRPPAAFWDGLWAEIAGQLYLGDLLPENQARIEKAMLNWAALKGVEVSETSVRARARKLWAVVSKEGRN